MNWDRYEEDFEFVFRTGEICRVPSVIAEYLSPKIARFRRCDPFCTFWSFDQSFSDSFGALDGLVRSLLEGGSLHVDNGNFVSLLRLCAHFENDSILCSLLDTIDPESLTFEEAILLLKSGIDVGVASGGRLNNLRTFVSSHFYEIGRDILDGLDLETAQLLLSSSSLRIESEDSLYDFIKSRCERDVSFASLFEFLCFENLSLDRISHFSRFANDHLLEHMSSGIWSRICGRLLRVSQQTLPRDEEAEAFNSTREFVYREMKPLDGIIAYFTRECGGNAYENGLVDVTASSCLDDKYSPRYVLDLGTDKYFQSRSEKVTWLCYDFRERRVIPTSYSLRSEWSLDSWVIEVSNDGTENSWREIDRRVDNHDFCERHLTRNFKISDVPSEPFRFLRIKRHNREMGRYDPPAYDSSSLNSFEIFGILYEK